MLWSAQGVEAPRPEIERQLPGRAGLALSLSLAAASGRADRGRLRRARQALAADLRRLRRGRLQRRLRAPSGRGPVRRRDLRDVPRAGRQPSALLHQLRPVALPAAAARLPRRSSTSTTSASRRCTSRTPSSGRAGARASIRATSRGCSGPGASARSATARSTSARSSRRWPQYGYDSWAVLEWECCLKHPEARCGRGRGVHPRAHHPRHREGVRRLRRRQERPEAGPAHARHLRARR